MLFSSLIFLLIFLPVVVLIYFIGHGKKWRNGVLLVFSIFFYAWGEPIYVFIMIGLIINMYVHALFMDRLGGGATNEKNWKRKALLYSSIITTLAPLIFFKYTDFLLINFQGIGRWFDPTIHIPMLHMALPLGISFYTFQILSYGVDVYLKRVDVQKNIFYLGTYVALFPQLVAGPIVRYIDVEKELNEDRKISALDFANGLKRFSFGLAKKVLIANTTAIMANYVFNTLPSSDYALLIIWLGVISFAIQIYFDFSGYSDMAIGMGQMFGFNFPENFKYPYTAWSITKFWRTWHITLGTWFREYIYIPMGGNRVGTIKFIFNILVVWFITGLWHGASWNFIIWGLWFGFFLLLEKFFLYKFFEKHKYIGIPFTLLVVMIGWVFFNSKDLHQAGHMIGTMFDFSNFGNFKQITKVGKIHNVVYLVIGIVLSTPVYQYIKRYEGNKYVWWSTTLLSLVLFILAFAFLIYNTYNPFIYFNF